MKIKILLGHRSMYTVLLNLLLVFMSKLSFAQKVYASSQNSQIYGLCLACSILNSQNTVGENEDDYSTTQIPIGTIAKIEQTLIFPAMTKQEKIIIGIGTGQASLSVQLLAGVAIETFNGNTSNNDYQIINNALLKLGTFSPKRGTLEFFVSKSFDRVKVTLNSGLLNLNGGLRIYYAYHRPHGCTYPPLDPLHYYSFNGNLNDVVNNYNMTTTSVPSFQNGMPCGPGLATTTEIPKYSLAAGIKLENGKTSRDLALNHTVSFWARTEQKQPGTKTPSLAIEPILDQLLILPDSLKLGISSAYPSFGLADNTEFGWAPNTTVSWDHYAINNENGNIHVFKNGSPVFNGDAPFYLDLIPLEPLINLTGNTISNIITLDRAKLDELVIYDKALKPEEIKTLYDSYNWILSDIISEKIINNRMKTGHKEEMLTVSPNPTAGHISLVGNVFLKDSEISLRNLSGQVVYHSKFISKKIDLPSSLPQGIYMLTIATQDKKMYTCKIILAR